MDVVISETYVMDVVISETYVMDVERHWQHWTQDVEQRVTKHN
jgi:hypothetical protein